jgi:hypothetical protein
MENTQIVNSGRPAGRDFRFDLLRGIALMMIFIDHVEWLNGMSVACRWTLSSLGLCDATEAFVFISGYVCGIRYWRILSTSGYLACQLRALIRVGQLWAANIVTLCIVLNLVVLCHATSGVHFAAYRLGGLSDPFAKQLPRMLLQIYQPATFDVLTLYMYLLLVLPLFLFGISRYPGWTWLVVLLLYLVVQFVPSLNYPLYDPHSGQLSGTARTFNHFAWQFLFFAGCILGTRQLHRDQYAIPRWAVAVSLTIVIAVAICKFIASHGSPASIEGLVKQGMQSIDESALARKATEGPVRIVYFCALAIVVAAALPDRLGRRAKRILNPLMFCGQNSLVTFCLGVFLTYAAHPMLVTSSNSTVVLLLVEVLGCGAMLLTGSVLSQRTLRRQNEDIPLSDGLAVKEL